MIIERRKDDFVSQESLHDIVHVIAISMQIAIVMEERDGCVFGIPSGVDDLWPMAVGRS